MRELKFRLWNPSSKIMTHPFTLEEAQEHDEGSVWGIKDVGAHLIAENIVMQYIGLKDKNDVEICEGDILRVEGLDTDFDRYISGPNEGKIIHYECEWFDMVASFDFVDMLEGESWPLGMDEGYWHVVGNIYQTPEMVK